jgi:hypothetical protein
MKNSILGVAAAAVFAASLTASVQAVTNYTETFSIDNDAAGWTNLAVATSPTSAQNPVTDVLDFSASNLSLFYLVADASASNGAFVGRYLNTLGDGVEFNEIRFDLAGTIPSGVAYFAELTDSSGTTCRYEIAPSTLPQSVIIPIDLTGTGWVPVAGSNTFAQLLGDVKEVAIGFSTQNPSVSIAGSIDNVQVIPEPGAVGLIGLAAGFALVSRRRK